MTEARLKVGMIGAGYILKPHALAVSSLDNAILHAVADTSRRRAEDAARQFGFAQTFNSVEELAESDCDVVHVLVPPFLHTQVAATLLEAGKSVFLEKPMALSSADCRRLGDLADKMGVRLGVNHNFLFLPGYERLRTAVKEGRLGHVDQVSCSWHSELAQLRHGPFDNWMLGAPANLFFEIGPHLAAMIIDLLGGAEVAVASATKPIELPTGLRAYRAWAAHGEHGAASFAISLSMSPGHMDRVVRVRATGSSAQLDYGRDIYWEEGAGPANPMFDAYEAAKRISLQAGAIASKDRVRRIKAALRKSLESEPFGESILRSVRAFYARSGQVDRRQHWSFGANVIEFCESVCERAGVDVPSVGPVVSKASIKKPRTRPTVLVVGGTGFIGRRLVDKLVASGKSVRVLTRSSGSASIAFNGKAVDLYEGFHGDREVAKSALDGIDTVYHLAKCEGRKWEDYVSGDVEPTAVLAEEAMAAGVRRFIYTGTIDCYDSASGSITGSTPLDAAIGRRNLYARSKAACERLLTDLCEKGLPLVILRPAIVIGGGAPASHIGVANFLSDTEVTYWGSGDNKLPLVLVDDVADALVAAANAEGVVGKSFVLTSPPLLSAREYVGELETRAGIKIRQRRRSPLSYWASDAIKELIKNLIRHPNRRTSSLHDWQCRTHRAIYDSRAAKEALGWQPASDRETLIERGIQAALNS